MVITFLVNIDVKPADIYRTQYVIDTLNRSKIPVV